VGKGAQRGRGKLYAPQDKEKESQQADRKSIGEMKTVK